MKYARNVFCLSSAYNSTNNITKNIENINKVILIKQIKIDFLKSEILSLKKTILNDERMKLVENQNINNNLNNNPDENNPDTNAVKKRMVKTSDQVIAIIQNNIKKKEAEMKKLEDDIKELREKEKKEIQKKKNKEFDALKLFLIKNNISPEEATKLIKGEN